MANFLPWAWEVYPQRSANPPSFGCRRRDTTSQCRCMRALSQSHRAKHDNQVPVMPLIGFGTGCNVDAMATVCKVISKKKTFRLCSNCDHLSTIILPTCSWRHTNTRQVQFFFETAKLPKALVLLKRQDSCSAILILHGVQYMYHIWSLMPMSISECKMRVIALSSVYPWIVVLCL